MKQHTVSAPESGWALAHLTRVFRVLLGLWVGGAIANKSLVVRASGAGLSNLSTRGMAASGSQTMIQGFVIAGSASKTVLIRAVGPGLAAFGVTGFLPHPVLTLVDGTGAVIESNSQWPATDSSIFSETGAFALTGASDDDAIVTTLPPGNYTAKVTAANAGGIVLLEIYDAGGNGQLINLSTRLSVGSGANIAIAGITVAAGSPPRTLLVRAIGPGLAAFGLNGLLSDPQLVVMDQNQHTLGSASANGTSSALTAAYAQAGAFAATDGDSGVILTVGPGSYMAQVSSSSGQSTGVAIVEVYDITGSNGQATPVGASPVLYIARLLPGAGSSGSIAGGYATIQYDPNTGIANVSAHFSNLSSPEVAAHLVLGTPGTSGAYMLELPLESFSDESWNIAASGLQPAASVLAALQSGQITLEVDTSNYTAGELEGTFVPAAATQAFTPPPAPPALAATALSAPTPTDAARFLNQATFGPTTAAINTVMSRGIVNWIGDQMAIPASSHLAGTRADAAAFPTPVAGLPSDETYTAINWANRLAAWWKIALTGPDQLRQRMAMALSEIFVVSDQATLLRPQAEALAHYYDILANDAFGNFRQLLQDVTLSPVMGVYLTDLQNQPGNSASGAAPDENYAREVQQLFTVGLLQLNPDGTVLLGADGLPVPTFSQDTVAETAKVFTGWSFANTGGDYFAFPADTRAAGASDASGWLNPMVAYGPHHDSSAKAIISPQQLPLEESTPIALPAGQTAGQDLAATLDALFNHPNTGPFVCRQLIQRLVTSNPSPGYVYRVAKVFANDGTGVRGNLGAVVKAILTDYEARSPDLPAQAGYGKLKEPLLRLTGFYRVLGAAAPNGRFLDSYYGDPRAGYAPGSLLALPEFFVAEGPLESPSVFNFFSPDFVAAGQLAAAGLVAPEMAIADATHTMNLTNEFSYYLFRDVTTLPAPASGLSPFLVMDLSALTPVSSNAPALLDSLNLLFCSNAMSAGTRNSILATLASLSPNTSASETAATAVFLTAVSPDAARQK